MTGPPPLVTGPCEPWTTAEAAAECCATIVDTDLTAMQTAVEQASDLLFELSGRRFQGLCERTVRPCRTGTCFSQIGAGILSPGMLPWNGNGLFEFGWDGLGWNWNGSRVCGCHPLPTITLAGYPVREILHVKIDDAELDAADYRLDRQRDLVRLNGERWPACQHLDADSGPGTFFVTYLYGREAPIAGVQAAKQLACELVKACGSGDGNDCELPRGTVRITRAGITVDAQALGLWLLGSQKTGMDQVDAFLTVYGRTYRRRAALMSPEVDRFPLPVE